MGWYRTKSSIVKGAGTVQRLDFVQRVSTVQKLSIVQKVGFCKDLVLYKCLYCEKFFILQNPCT